MQQLETYFGCRVTLGKSITQAEYEAHLADIQAAIERADIEDEKYQLYICQVRLDPVENHFDPAPLHDKLGAMQIHLAVNKKHRDEDKIYFLNHRVNHTINKRHRAIAEKFDVKYTIPGAYFGDTPRFDEIIYVVVANSVRGADRKIRVKFLASPTSAFARKLRNVSTASTLLRFNYIQQQLNPWVDDPDEPDDMTDEEIEAAAKKTAEWWRSRKNNMHDASPEDEPRDPRGRWTSSGGCGAPEFKRWFGESKVVDEDGNPQLLLHKSHELGLSELKAGSAGGIFFTSNWKSELYGPEKYYAYLKVEHPLDVSKGAEGGTLNEWKQVLSDAGLDVGNVKFDSSLSAPEASRRTYGFKNSEGQQAYNFFELIGENDYWADDGNLVKEIRRQGFDGVKSEPEDDGDTWIVFDHGQIKSTDALGKTK